MRFIPLRAANGNIIGHASVDDGDFDSVMLLKWHKLRTGYAACKMHKKAILMHRLILGDPAGEVDHIDGNKLNNQRKNLRIVTHAQNLQNQAKSHIDSKSGYRGVTWQPENQKWRAKCCISGKQHHIGLFDTAELADLAAKNFRAENMPFSPDAETL